MEHPVKTAPCPLYFAAHGGQFTSTGLPVFNRAVRGAEDQDEGYLAASNCDRAYDCGTCPLLRQWVEARIAEGWTVEWECIDCVRKSWEYERDNPQVERMLPGFYQSGRDPRRAADDPDYDEDRPPLSGCTSCGWESSFLQIILRRPRV